MHRRLSTRLRTLAATAVLLGAGTGAVAIASPAQAVVNCNKGLNTATTAWATCTGSATWRLVTHCYLTGSTATQWRWQGGGTQTRFSSCPSWSHVTAIVVEQQS